MNTQVEDNGYKPIPEKKRSRADQRHQNRVGKELNITFGLMTDRFMDFFTNSEDPQGQEMVDYMKERSAQWVTYCKRKNILPKFHGALDEFMNGVMRDYLATKAGEALAELEKAAQEAIGKP